MSSFYSAEHRALQARFDTGGLAEMMEHGIVHGEFSEAEREFVESRDMFFLSTIDPAGRPTVSYKGGGAGFVRVVAPARLIFPCYDGNGMFYSMGNIAATAAVGLLFIDLERPNRLRVQGNASISLDDPALADYPEAQLMVSVAIEHIWVNCPRYIHKYRRVETSRFVPAADRPTPLPDWKRLDIVQPALSPAEQARTAEAGGTITQEEYARRMAGDGV